MEVIENNHLREIRYYSKEEILKICEKYNISLDNFILYSLVKNVVHNHSFYIDTYKNILEERNRLWIGNSRVDNTIIIKHYEEIQKRIKIIIYTVKRVYPEAFESIQDQEDAFQNLLMFFMETGSEIVNNFMIYNNPDWGRYFHGKLRRHLIIIVLNKFRILKNEDKQIKFEDDDRKFDFKDENTNVEKMAIEKLEQNEFLDVDNCILLFGKLLTEGMTIKEAEETICKQFAISKKELGDYMKIYMKNHNVKNFDFNLLGIEEVDDQNDIKTISLKNKNYQN